jgi:hypothetical protein
MFRQSKKYNFTPQQKAGLERVYFDEYKRLTKAGEAGPFASMMAARLQLVERNKMIEALDG